MPINFFPEIKCLLIILSSMIVNQQKRALAGGMRGPCATDIFIRDRSHLVYSPWVGFPQL